MSIYNRDRYIYVGENTALKGIECMMMERRNNKYILYSNPNDDSEEMGMTFNVDKKTLERDFIPADQHGHAV